MECSVKNHGATEKKSPAAWAGEGAAQSGHPAAAAGSGSGAGGAGEACQGGSGPPSRRHPSSRCLTQRSGPSAFQNSYLFRFEEHKIKSQ